jgi:hypothetical protein
MIKIGVGVLFVFFLINCSNTVLEPVNLTSFFNDDSSKIWVLNHPKTKMNGINSVELTEKLAMIFYNSGNVILQKISDLGSKQLTRGTFFVNSKQQLLEINFKKNKWKFKLNFLKGKDVLLSPMKGSKFKKKIILEPYPEY